MAFEGKDFGELGRLLRELGDSITAPTGRTRLKVADTALRGVFDDECSRSPDVTPVKRLDIKEGIADYEAAFNQTPSVDDLGSYSI